MKFLNFHDFVNESEDVKLDKELREYTLTHVREALFQLRSENYYKEFSVEPYKKETIGKLKDVHNLLTSAIDSLEAGKLLDAINSAEMIDYTYGNVYPSKYDLKDVPEITMNLNDDQLRTFNASAKEFLLNNFSQLNKEVKENITESLRERAEVLCAVIEALFYYIRTVDKENYYDNMNRDEILKEYEDVIEKTSKLVGFSIEGPFADLSLSPISEDTRVAFWKCKKDGKEFNIFGTILPRELYTEDQIGGSKGLRLSISGMDDAQPDEGYSYFSLEELEERVKEFYDKNLKG
jgi:hypothetical protein